jgi:hypothetical protein
MPESMPDNLLDNITLHGPQATIAVRAENLAYDVHDIDQEHGVVRFAIGKVGSAPACQTC